MGSATISSTVRLRSGREMPVLGLGTWQLVHDTAGVVAEALRTGYRLIDTSGDYGTEPGVGDGLRRSGVARSAVFVTTKVEEDDDPRESTESALDALGTDYVDLVLLHRPPPVGDGAELWRGLLDVRDSGLARDVGVSNYDATRIEALMSNTDEPPAVNQIEWSPFGWDAGMLEFCRQHGIVVQAYSPLTRARRLDDDRLIGIAESHGKQPAQILLRWDVQRGVVPLPKANDLGHLRANAEIFDFTLSDEEMSRLDQLNEHYSSLGTLPYVAS